MDERKQIERELAQIKDAMKELEIRYELYFSGEERLEPLRERNMLRKKLLNFTHRRIIQTNLRFQFQNLATRFHSYQGYWDRILRLMDEGKYHRHLARIRRPKEAPREKDEPAAAKSETSLDRLYRDVQAAYVRCEMQDRTPTLDRIHQFIEHQREKIRTQFGDREVEFAVIIDEGKPVIKAKARKS